MIVPRKGAHCFPAPVSKAPIQVPALTQRRGLGRSNLRTGSTGVEQRRKYSGRLVFSCTRLRRASASSSHHRRVAQNVLGVADAGTMHKLLAKRQRNAAVVHRSLLIFAGKRTDRRSAVGVIPGSVNTAGPWIENRPRRLDNVSIRLPNVQVAEDVTHCCQHRRRLLVHALIATVGLDAERFLRSPRSAR